MKTGAKTIYFKTVADPIDCVTPLIATSVATLPDMQGSGAVRDLREAANDAAEWRVLA